MQNVYFKILRSSIMTDLHATVHYTILYILIIVSEIGFRVTLNTAASLYRYYKFNFLSRVEIVYSCNDVSVYSDQWSTSRSRTPNFVYYFRRVSFVYTQTFIYINKHTRVYIYINCWKV